MMTELPVKNGTWRNNWKPKRECLCVVLLESWLLGAFKGFLCSFLWVAQWNGKPSTFIPVRVKLQVVGFFSVPFYGMQNALIIDEIPHSENPKGAWDFLHGRCSPSQLQQKRKQMLQRNKKALKHLPNPPNISRWIHQTFSLVFSDAVFYCPCPGWLPGPLMSVYHKLPINLYCP